jgi:hypothetical protein
MKKAICALLVLAMAMGTIGPWTPTAAAGESRTLEEKFRHNSPVPAMVVLFPLALAAFVVDVPIYLVSRKQPLTNGLMQVELIDGYNPITDHHSGGEADQHGLDVTGGY